MKLLLVLLLLLLASTAANSSSTSAPAPTNKWASYLASKNFLPAMFDSFLDAFMADPAGAQALIPETKTFARDHAKNVAYIRSAYGKLTEVEATARREEIYSLLVPEYTSTARLVALEAFSKQALLPAFFDRYLGSGNRLALNDYQALVLGLKMLEVSALSLNSKSKFGVNHLSLLDPYQTAQSKGYLPRAFNATSNARQLLTVNNVALPESVNWLERGAVGPVLNQGSCGSCWAFSAVGAMEGRLAAARNGTLTSLSVQQVLNCAAQVSTKGCNGGNPGGAFEQVSLAGGVTSAAINPYVSGSGGVTPPCSEVEQENADAVVTLATNIGFARTEQELMQALAFGGPVSIAIATPSCFESYTGGGVLMQEDCDCFKGGVDSIDHAVLLVGYGVHPTSNVPFWLVKNSWGPGWGMDGYIMLERGASGRSGMCGLLVEATYPLQVGFTPPCTASKDGEGVPSFCTSALQGITYSNLNVTTGAALDGCYASAGGPFTTSTCSDTDDGLPDWAWGLIALAIALVVIALVLLATYLVLGTICCCCRSTSKPEAKTKSTKEEQLATV